MVVHTVEISLDKAVTKMSEVGPLSATMLVRSRMFWSSLAPNEITIYGFDLGVDSDSIRITGHGQATVTDTQTSFVDRKEAFEDVFPEYKSEDDFESLDEEDSDDDFGVDRTELAAAQKERTRLVNALNAARDELRTFETSKAVLEDFVEGKHNEIDLSTLAGYLHQYQQENKELTLKCQEASAATVELEKELKTATNLATKLQRRFDRARNAAAKPAREKREQLRKALQKKSLQKRQEKAEALSFWTSRVRQLVVHLDCFGDSSDTSRRNSIASTKKQEPATVLDPNTVNFSLMYVTRNAKWSPRYELTLNTPTSSGKMVYRAEYQNTSSEIWRDVKIILSTSQTTFSGLNEVIPWLHPWFVKLLKCDPLEPPSKGKDYWQEGLENRVEVEARKQRKRAENVQFRSVQHMQMARHAVFDRPRGYNPQGLPLPPPPPPAAAPRIVESRQLARRSDPRPFHGSEAEAVTRVSERGLNLPSLVEDDATSSDDDDDVATLYAGSNALVVQESSQQNYGLTTTYDIPGVRTLRPSSVSRRLQIAELELPSVTFSHLVIPKLRPAAFLKAKVTNASTTTMLRGDAGLTLDGIFLGTTKIPHCGPKNTASLSLGVDPGIQVKYAKPTVRRSTTGFFNKEDSAVFTRYCRISNTKSTSVSLLVLDQVPTSEDERLRIRILQPAGLDKDGDKVKIGPDAGSPKSNWGKGTVSMGKSGEVAWELKLEKGADIKLVLEYEARIPSGQKIAGLN
ncbi:predicted protein [Uncinocarpus reesii 1704]|uniref:Mucoidy inhibitor A n=1 Tax=Uncinocarpus reesii (strain UAMH 1704) TaxID=336963 RepID=C4JFF8_UNCRE|nr:uncharacterized protein UREG_00972 [Uncinocarpus reesii 1704]EEP76123.1 predicted protein [Uncinocarpus reesii 1704]